MPSLRAPSCRSWASAPKKITITTKKALAPFVGEEPKIWVLYLTLNDSLQVRTFQYSQSFYSIYEHRHRKIVFGEWPKELSEVGTIDQRVWEKHQTYLQRLESFPLKKAAYYRDLQESSGVKSVRGLSEITGEDWSHIVRVLKTLELPEHIQKFLKENQQPEVLECFNLRRLLELVRIPDDHRKMMRFRELLDESTRHSTQFLT